jgi:hypothetical protein
MIRRSGGGARPAASSPALGLALMLTAIVSGCQKDTDPGPGGVTVGEARALDEAAAMLEKRPAPPQVEATGEAPSDAPPIPVPPPV